MRGGRRRWRRRRRRRRRGLLGRWGRRGRRRWGSSSAILPVAIDHSCIERPIRNCLEEAGRQVESAVRTARTKIHDLRLLAPVVANSDLFIAMRTPVPLLNVQGNSKAIVLVPAAAGNFGHIDVVIREPVGITLAEGGIVAVVYRLCQTTMLSRSRDTCMAGRAVRGCRGYITEEGWNGEYSEEGGYDTHRSESYTSKRQKVPRTASGRSDGEKERRGEGTEQPSWRKERAMPRVADHVRPTKLDGCLTSGS
jgi:hypothetical protein